MAAGVDFRNLDTGEELQTVRDRLTHAAVYTGAEGSSRRCSTVPTS